MEDLREGILLGLGNPLLDISATVDEEFLTKYGVKSNDAILAEEKHKPLYVELIDKYSAEYIAGGSVQNSLRVAQWLLERPSIATFFGCVGNDDYAKILEKKARSSGLNVKYQYTDKEPTGTCGVLITGAERSLVANLAAANCFTPDHIDNPENKKLLDAAHFYYISGFFLTVSPDSIQAVAKLAHTNDRVFMMNLSAPFLSTYFKKPMMEAMPYVDVLFGNETEAATFAKEQNFDTEDLKEIGLKISQLSKQNEKRARTVIITQGSDPVILVQDGTVREFPVSVLTQQEIIDTNGAGDAFVGGFLAQYVQNRPIEVCIQCGIWAATEIIKRSGCTYSGSHYVLKPIGRLDDILFHLSRLC